jgi:YD repeat-containing protein
MEPGEFGHNLYQFPLIVRRLVEREETTIDDNGNSMVNTVLFDYNRYGFQSSVKTTDSKNDTITNLTLFPGDHTSAIADAVVLNKMVRRNMLRQPYWQGNYKRNVLQKYNHTIFSDQWGVNDSLIMPKTDSLWILGGTQGSVAANYQAYDKYGNILQLTERNGMTNSFTWNANNTYPLSQTVNATNTSVLYDGFEDAGTWTGVTRDNGQARTGKYAGLITNTGAFVNQRWTSVSLTAATKFRYSGWVYSSGPGATINLLMKKTGEAGAYSYIDNMAVAQSGKWIYVDKEYNVPADVKSMSIRLDNNGTGKVWFDDIRLRPAASRMATYTYSPLIGVTSKTDENNLMLKYEYDGLGRLKVIRDQDGNVLKQIDYQYQAPLTK